MNARTPTLRGARARFPSRRNERGTSELGRLQPARPGKWRRVRVSVYVIVIVKQDQQTN